MKKKVITTLKMIVIIIGVFNSEIKKATSMYKCFECLFDYFSKIQDEILNKININNISGYIKNKTEEEITNIGQFIKKLIATFKFNNLNDLGFKDDFERCSINNLLITSDFDIKEDILELNEIIKNKSANKSIKK